MTTCRIGLRERIRMGQAAPQAAEERAEVVRSIADNLRRILNTRAGSSLAQDDYGISSPHELLQGFPVTLPKALAEIRACIQKYEPRLAAVAVRQVKQEPGDIQIRFQITGVLASDRSPVALTTAMGGDALVRVQP